MSTKNICTGLEVVGNNVIIKEKAMAVVTGCVLKFQPTNDVTATPVKDVALASLHIRQVRDDVRARTNDSATCKKDVTLNSW